MHMKSEFAVWIKGPMANAGVVIVISPSLPRYIAHKLQIAIDDWDQVACLRVEQPKQLMHDWLRAETSPSESVSPPCVANQLLGSIAKSCLLLAVEVAPASHLTWLGSVCGHKLRFVELDSAAQSYEVMDRQVEQVLSVARSLAKDLLLERCVF